MSLIQPMGGVPIPVDRLAPNNQYDVAMPCCGTCRWWLADQPTGTESQKPDDLGFGVCRRRPPVIVEALLPYVMTPPQFGRHLDIEEGVSTSDLFNISHYPGTFVTDGCGEFERLPEKGGQS